MRVSPDCPSHWPLRPLRQSMIRCEPPRTASGSILEATTKCMLCNEAVDDEATDRPVSSIPPALDASFGRRCLRGWALTERRGEEKRQPRPFRPPRPATVFPLRILDIPPSLPSKRIRQNQILWRQSSADSMLGISAAGTCRQSCLGLGWRHTLIVEPPARHE